MVNLSLTQAESEYAWVRNESPTTIMDSDIYGGTIITSTEDLETCPLTDLTDLTLEENALSDEYEMQSFSNDKFIIKPTTTMGNNILDLGRQKETKLITVRHSKFCCNPVWLAIIPSFVNFVIVNGIGYSLSLFFVAFTASFPSESKSRVSAITSIHYSMTLISGPFASHVVDMFGCGRANMIGGFLAFAGFFCSSVLTPNVYVLMIFLGFVSGLGVAIIYLVSYTSIIVYFDTRKELATGIFSCGSGVGALLFGPLVSYLLNWYEWRGSLLILSAVFLQTLACGCLFILFDTLFLHHYYHRRGKRSAVSAITETPSQQISNSKMTDAALYYDKELNELQSIPIIGYRSLSNVNIHHGSHSLLKLDNIHDKRNNLFSEFSRPTPPDDTTTVNTTGIKSTFLRRSFSAFRHQITRRTIFFRNFKFVNFTLSNIILYASGHTSYLYAIDRASKLNGGCSIGTLISITGLSNTIGHVVYGIASQRISDKEELEEGGRGGKNKNGIVYLYCVSILICGGATIAFPFAHAWASIVIFVFALEFLLSSNYTLASIITYNLTCPPQAETFPTAFGLIFTAQGIGALIGAPIGGALIDFYGNYDMAFYLAGIFICVSGLMLIVEKSPIKCFLHDEWFPNPNTFCENEI